MRSIAGTARDNGMDIFSCAEERDFSPYGIRPGKCIDDTYISRVFGLKVPFTKDPSQRNACGCVTSRDIGAYDTCSVRLPLLLRDKQFRTRQNQS